MRAHCILFLFTVLFKSLNAQTRTITVKTDSSVIETHYSTYGRKWSDEFFNGKDLVRQIDYHVKDTGMINRIRYLDTTLAFSSISGLFTCYSDAGTLNWIIDEDKRIIIYADTFRYPNYNLLVRMKEKSDSIIKGLYGSAFFAEHIKWNIGGSYYFDKTYQAEPSFSVEWLREGTKDKYKATEFNIRYDIYYDDQIFEEGIKIIIDENGQLIPSHAWNVNWTIYNSGLEKRDSAIRGFTLTNKEAIELAIKNGLKKRHLKNVRSQLSWESNKDSLSGTFNGHFTISVYQKLSTSTPRKKEEYGAYTFHYKVWMFDPWTGEFMGTKKMHSDHYFEPGIMRIGPIVNDE